MADRDSIFLGQIEERAHYQANAFYLFHKKLREIDGKEPMEFRQYIKTLTILMGSIMNAIIEHPVEYVAPSRGGKYFIEAVKTKKPAKFMDWEKYNETKKYSRYLVPLLRGYTYRMRWAKYRKDKYMGHMRFYKFRPCLNVKRGVKRLFRLIHDLRNDPYRMDFERM